MKNKKIEKTEVEGVKDVFDVFYRTINPQINFGNKTTRSAAEWLIKKYGLQKVLNMAKYACEVQLLPYSPTITTPYQLKEKLSALIKFKLTQKSNKPKIWRKNSTQSHTVEHTTKLLRKQQTGSSQQITKTLLS